MPGAAEAWRRPFSPAARPSSPDTGQADSGPGPGVLGTRHPGLRPQRCRLNLTLRGQQVPARGTAPCHEAHRQTDRQTDGLGAAPESRGTASRPRPGSSADASSPRGEGGASRPPASAVPEAHLWEEVREAALLLLAQLLCKSGVTAQSKFKEERKDLRAETSPEFSEDTDLQTQNV